MKKTIIISSVLIITILLIAIISCFVYFNSNSYKLKLTLKSRKEKIDRLNSIQRVYIHEGVYTFDCDKTTVRTFKDKFGEDVTTSNKSFYGSGEVSFKSERIIITLKNKREEIIFGEPYIRQWQLRENYIAYNFPIIKWEAYNNNTQFFQYDISDISKSRSYADSVGMWFMEPTLILKLLLLNPETPEEKEIGIEFSISAANVHRNGTTESGFSSLLVLESFKSLPYNNSGSIRLNDLLYKYEILGSAPSYVNAKYAPDIYDLDPYKELLKHYMKNPFVLKERW